MNPLEVLLGPQKPPAKLKVYAPNGDTKECVAYLGIREHIQDQQWTELFLLHECGRIEVLNKTVVVKNLETGSVCYNPRTAPLQLGHREFITQIEKLWLKKHPHWPAILELWDNPVHGGNEGLNPDGGNESIDEGEDDE